MIFIIHKLANKKPAQKRKNGELTLISEKLIFTSGKFQAFAKLLATKTFSPKDL